MDALFSLAFEKCMLTKVAEINDALREVKKGLGFLTAKVDFLMRAGGLEGSNDDLPGDVKFPLNSSSDLNALLVKLQDSQFKRILVSKFSTWFQSNE